MFEMFQWAWMRLCVAFVLRFHFTIPTETNYAPLHAQNVTLRDECGSKYWIDSSVQNVNNSSTCSQLSKLCVKYVEITSRWVLWRGCCSINAERRRFEVHMLMIKQRTFNFMSFYFRQSLFSICFSMSSVCLLWHGFLTNAQCQNVAVCLYYVSLHWQRCRKHVNHNV